VNFLEREYDDPGSPIESAKVHSFSRRELPVLQRALEEVLGTEAEKARLCHLSGFTDHALSSLMERLREELLSLLIHWDDKEGDLLPQKRANLK
jgi:hypothetical protein